MIWTDALFIRVVTLNLLMLELNLKKCNTVKDQDRITCHTTKLLTKINGGKNYANNRIKRDIPNTWHYSSYSAVRLFESPAISC